MLDSRVAVVALARRQAAVEALLTHAQIQISATDARVQLYFLAAEQLNSPTVSQRLTDPRQSSVGFQNETQPLIAVGEHFFPSPLPVQVFQLTHELRHAYQQLGNLTWQMYHLERCRVVQNYQRVLADAWRLLSGPTEWDAQHYAFGYIPAIGTQLVVAQAEKMRRTVSAIRQPQRNTLAICSDLLPSIYEWQRLLQTGLIGEPDAAPVRQTIVDVRVSLTKYTRVGRNSRAQRLVERYLAAEQAQFLSEASQLLQHLLTLQG